MIVKFNRAGKSFKGLGQYLGADVKAATADRVAWTHTLNCANDHVAAAIHEMYNTYQDADLLKEAAGVKRGGQPLQNPVRHFSLNWHPDESPSKEQMIEAAEGFLERLGWDEHQAILYSHTDKPHPHVHCMLNAVHPETGRVLDESFSKREASKWAAEYERENGHIYCTQRGLPPEEREPSPTRPAHIAMKEAEREFSAQEKARQEAGEKRGAEEAGPKSASQEWDELKKAQREARQGFFEDGRDAFRDIRDTAFRQTREEFRDIWAAFYKLQRDGLEMPRLIEIRDDLTARQHEALTERRDRYCAELRETRDTEYAGLLAGQRAERAQLTARLAGDEPRHEIPENGLAAHNQNMPEIERHVGLTDAFRSAADEVTRETNLTVTLPHERVGAAGRDTEIPFDNQDWTPRAAGPRVRPGEDIAANVTGGAIGGLAEISERLFDGFFGQPVTPQPKTPHQPRQADQGSERSQRNVFAEAAEQAKRRAELEADDKKRSDDWWDERRARSRD